jgi:hypothetical protein
VSIATQSTAASRRCIATEGGDERAGGRPVSVCVPASRTDRPAGTSTRLAAVPNPNPRGERRDQGRSLVDNALGRLRRPPQRVLIGGRAATSGRSATEGGDERAGTRARDPFYLTNARGERCDQGRAPSSMTRQPTWEGAPGGGTWSWHRSNIHSRFITTSEAVRHRLNPAGTRRVALRAVGGHFRAATAAGLAGGGHLAGGAGGELTYCTSTFRLAGPLVPLRSMKAFQVARNARGSARIWRMARLW